MPETRLLVDTTIAWIKGAPQRTEEVVMKTKHVKGHLLVKMPRRKPDVALAHELLNFTMT